MTKLRFAAHVVGFLRRTKGASLARYAFVCAAASHGEEGATVNEIAEAASASDGADIASMVSAIEDAGLLVRIPNSKPLRFVPTPEGLLFIGPMIDPDKFSKPRKKRQNA